MPIFKGQTRITSIYKSGKKIKTIYFGSNLIWKDKLSFKTSSWSEIKKMIDDGSWKEQGWDVGDTHSLNLKNGNKMQVRIIGINDGREVSDDFNFQVDKNISGEKAHLTLELTSCLPENNFLFNSSDDSISQTYSESLVYQNLQPNGELFENLPDDLKPLIFPVVKYSGISGQNKDSQPQQSENYLFLLSVLEYVGQNNYEINQSEGLIYELYNRNPYLVQRSILNQNENVYFWTRSASQIQDNIKNYFWSIGSSNNYSMYPSNTELPISYAFCI